MKAADFSDLDLNIARARIALSLLAILSLYVDPSAGGWFHLDRYALITLACHLAYSLSASFASWLGFRSALASSISTGLDLVFATAIAVLTEGRTSPSYVFFVFAIVAVGFRSGFRETMLVTLASMSLYLAATASSQGIASMYLMRAIYLAIAGYLIGFFSRQRAQFEGRMRELEMKAERETIARSLHDGYVQVLAGMNLRLQSCRELLDRGRSRETSAQLTELQTGVAREFDEVRAYVRSLAELDFSLAMPQSAPDPEFHIRIEFGAHGLIVEQILQIVLEGMRNAWRHGKARRVNIDVSEAQGVLHVSIAADGVGFQGGEAPPWAIASRVAEFGGNLKIGNGTGLGAHLEIEIPNR